MDGPPLSPIPGFAAGYQFTPWLASTEPLGARAGFVYIEHPTPFDEFLQVASVALDDPWGPWPTSLGPSAFHGLNDGFVIGAGDNGTFSMLTTDEPKNASNDPAGMVVWAPQAGSPGAAGQFFDDVPPGTPLLVTSNGERYLAGFQRLVGGDLRHLTLARVAVGGGGLTSVETSVACATGATLAGAAVPQGDGFMAAFSNGRPFGKCQTDDLIDGPPSRLQIVTMKDAPSNAMQVFEEDEPSTYILQVHLSPTNDGAWAAWERISNGPPFERRIRLVHLDAAGSPVGGSTLEVGFGVVSAPFAIASLGARVAIATKTDAGGVGVIILGGDGEIVSQTSLDGGPGLEPDGSVRLLGSPSQSQLLVGWAESSTIGNDNRVVRLARLACAGP